MSLKSVMECFQCKSYFTIGDEVRSTISEIKENERFCALCVCKCGHVMEIGTERGSDNKAETWSFVREYIPPKEVDLIYLEVANKNESTHKYYDCISMSVINLKLQK